MASSRSPVDIDDLLFKKDMALALKKYKVDWKPIFRLLAKQFRRSKKAIFTEKKKFFAFKDLGPRYKKQKLKKWGKIYPILVASGQMALSVIDKHDPDAITEITSESLTIGSKDPILQYHEFGTRKMPQRRVMYWGPEAPTEKNLGLARVASDTIKRSIANQLGLPYKEVEGHGVVIGPK